MREGSSSGLLDVFEVTDELVTELLEALSGTHIGFGSLTLQRRGEQGEYAVWIDGTPIGTDVEAVERLLLGRRTVSVRQRRLLREVELLSSVVQVPEDGRVSVSFEIPGIMEEEQRELDRLTGIAKGGWNERARAAEVEAALERGVELLSSSDVQREASGDGGGVEDAGCAARAGEVRVAGAGRAARGGLRGPRSGRGAVHRDGGARG